jgi:phosphate transport system substrate-binding protein
MQRFGSLILTTLIIFFLAACDSSETKKPTDTTTSGSIDIAVDETYKPVIEQELRVFDSSFPEAHITAHYEPEAACFKDFFDNKVRLILVTRQLTKQEDTLCDQKQIAPTTESLAADAIAVITNKAATDSMDVSEIKGILTGTFAKKYTVVFDNEGSSTVRFIVDSLLGGQKLGSNVFAAKSNDSVIAYVAKNPDAIGFVGLSYVHDTADSTVDGTFINTVNVVAVKNDTTNAFYKPFQAYIALKYYPFTRKLYYINRDNYMGLARGFANFLKQERGQLVFNHAYLFPLKMSVTIREAEVNP